MTAYILPEGKQSFTTSSGAPLVGGKVYTYAAGTSTPKTTWSDAAQTAPNTNPVILDGRGEATIFWDGAYKVTLTDSADVPIWTVDAVQDNSDTLRADLGVSTGASLVGFIQAGTGATVRTSLAKMREALSARDFGAVGDGVANDTTAIQAAITFAAAGGRTLFVPAGNYRASLLTMPSGSAGIMTLFGEPKTIIAPINANQAVLWVQGDISFSGIRTVSDLTILNAGAGSDTPGTIVGVTGIKIGVTGSDGSAALQTQIERVQVTGATIGFDIENGQLAAFRDNNTFFCDTGHLSRSHPVYGGGNALRFDNCKSYIDRVGFMIDNVDAGTEYPLAGNQFDNCVAQGSRVSALAIFGGTVFRNETLSFDNFYIEGAGAGPNASVTYRGRTIFKSCVQVDFSAVTFNSSSFYNSLQVPMLLLYRNAEVTLRDCLISGGGASFFVQADNTFTKVHLVGNTVVQAAVGGGYIATWTGINVNNTSAPAILWGAPLRRPFNSRPNLYPATGLFPSAPNTAVTTATASKVWDAEQGYVSKVQYTSAIGNNGFNVAIISMLSTTTTVGDLVCMEMLMRADSITTLRTTPQTGAAFGIADVKLTTQWQRVMAYGKVVTASVGGYDWYVHPIAADGPAVYFAKAMTDLTPVNTDRQPVVDQMKYGNYNSRFDPAADMLGPNAPTTGTWTVGRRVINSVPTVGQPKAWVCTVAGTPGTWVSEGNL